MTLGKKPFGNIVGKRENAGNPYFLLLPKCLLSISNTNLHLDYMYIEMSSANTFKLDWSQILSLGYRINSLPNIKILALSKLKAEDKINLTHKLEFDFERVENIVGKGENAGYQHFLLFPQCFQSFLSRGG